MTTLEELGKECNWSKQEREKKIAGQTRFIRQKDGSKFVIYERSRFKTMLA
jgi:hypothetical protein